MATPPADEFAGDIATFDKAHERRRIAALIIRDATPLCDAAIAIIIEYRWLEPRDIRIWPRCDIGVAPRYLLFAISAGMADHAAAIFTTYNRAKNWPEAAEALCGTDEKKIDTLFAAMEVAMDLKECSGKLAPDEFAAVILHAYVTFDDSLSSIDRRIYHFLLDTNISERFFTTLSETVGYDEDDSVLRGIITNSGPDAAYIEKIIYDALHYSGGEGVDEDDMQQLFDA